MLELTIRDKSFFVKVKSQTEVHEGLLIERSNEGELFVLDADSTPPVDLSTQVVIEKVCGNVKS